MRSVIAPGAAGAGRRGATLAELLVGAALGAVVAAAAAGVVGHARRAWGAESDRAAARAQLAHAGAVLAHELRALAPAADSAAVDGADVADGGDLLEASDSAVELRATIGASVACAVDASVTLAGSEPGVGWWSTAPRVGDVAAVHDPGAAPGSADDRWRERGIVGVEPGACPAAGAFGGAAPHWRLALAAPALPASVTLGAPVRVLRRRRYALYRGGDGGWALGVRDWGAGGAAGPQPLAGPFAAPGAGGLRVALRDSAGADASGAPGAAADVELHLVATWGAGAAARADTARVRVRTAGWGAP